MCRLRLANIKAMNMPVLKILHAMHCRQVLPHLEGGKYGICYSSGLAAMDAVIKLLQSGDEVLCGHDLYGGSYRLLVRVYGPMGIKSSYIDMTDLDLVRKSISPETKMIWLETPTNPTLQITRY